jgi:hypothetical protein
MTHNIGTTDRFLRIALGILLILTPFVGALALFQSPVATVVAVVVGLVLIGTSAMRFCPLYRMLGVQTCKL